MAWNGPQNQRGFISPGVTLQRKYSPHILSWMCYHMYLYSINTRWYIPDTQKFNGSSCSPNLRRLVGHGYRLCQLCFAAQQWSNCWIIADQGHLPMTNQWHEKPRAMKEIPQSHPIIVGWLVHIPFASCNNPLSSPINTHLSSPNFTREWATSTFSTVPYLYIISGVRSPVEHDVYLFAWKWT